MGTSDFNAHAKVKDSPPPFGDHEGHVTPASDGSQVGFDDFSTFVELSESTQLRGEDGVSRAKTRLPKFRATLRRLWNPTRNAWVVRLTFVGVGILLAGLVVLGLTQDLRQMGYFGVFLASFTSGASMFIPLPGLAAIVAASLILQPWAVGLLAGVGGALGEMTGYAVGCSSHKIVRHKGVPNWLYRTARSHMALTIITVSIIPNPFIDFVGIIAGRLCYPVPSFLAYTLLGKTVRASLIAYAAAWGLPLVGSWFG